MAQGDKSKMSLPTDDKAEMLQPTDDKAAQKLSFAEASPTSGGFGTGLVIGMFLGLILGGLIIIYRFRKAYKEGNMGDAKGMLYGFFPGCILGAILIYIRYGDKL